LTVEVFGCLVSVAVGRTTETNHSPHIDGRSDSTCLVHFSPASPRSSVQPSPISATLLAVFSAQVEEEVRSSSKVAHEPLHTVRHEHTEARGDCVTSRGLRLVIVSRSHRVVPDHRSKVGSGPTQCRMTKRQDFRGTLVIMSSGWGQRKTPAHDRPKSTGSVAGIRGISHTNPFPASRATTRLRNPSRPGVLYAAETGHVTGVTGRA
jgi:hypothetical protein